MKSSSIINVDSLRERLETAGVPQYYYRIGGFREEALCIVKEGTQWHVFEGERGFRFNERCFDNEQDACIYFIKRIKVFL